MRHKRPTEHTASQQPRPARRIHEEPRGKPAAAGCPGCGASYRTGRWTWEAAPADSDERVCPACERIANDYPAGVLHVEGEFARTHRAELLGLLRNIEERERTDHPLKRIMAITDADRGGFTVTATDAKLAQTFGLALRKAYEGQLELPPTTSDTGNLVRVHWSRD